MCLPSGFEVTTPLEHVLENLETIAQHLHQFTDLKALLVYGVEETRTLLAGDRVLVYQFLPRGDGIVLAESVGAEWSSIVGQLIHDPCFAAQWVEPYRQGRVSHISDTATSDLAPCHLELLTRLQVQANLVVPILTRSLTTTATDRNPQLWGLLIVHQCATPRVWKRWEIQLLKQIALHLGLALPPLEWHQQMPSPANDTDIRDRQAVELAFRHRQDQQWGRLVNILEDFLIVADINSHILTVNQRVEDQLGYTHSELLTMTVLDLHPPAQRQAAAEILAGMMAGRQTVCTIPLQAKDGTCIAVETKVKQGTWEGRPALFGICRDVSDRQAAEDALKEQTSFLRSIYDGSDVSIFVVDVLPDGSFCYAGLNPAHERLTGLATQDLQGKTPEQVLPLETAVLVREHYARCVEVGQSIDYEECLPFQGEVTWWLTKLTPLRDATGRIVRLIGTSLNVSDRKRMEQALRESQQKYQTLFQVLPVGVSITNTQGHLVEVNPTSERVLGLSSEEHLRRDVDAVNWTIIRPDGSPMSPGEYASVRAIQENRLVENVEMGIVQADGAVRWITVSAAPIPLEQYGVAIAYVDITDIKRVKDLLLLQSAALNASANVIMITDRQGMIEWANPAFTTLTRYTLAEAIGKNPRDLLKSTQQDPAFYSHLWQTITAGEVWQGELINRRKDGSVYPEAMTITPVCDDQGEIRHFIAIKQDVTERHQMEQHLRDRDEMLRKISEQVPGVVYQYQLYPDGRSRFPYASEAIRQIYAVTPAEVLQDAQVVFDRFHPDDLRFVQERIWQSFHTLELWHSEYRVILPEQGLRWLEGHAMPERLADGSVLWHGYIWDISDRKHTEALLQQEFQRERVVHIINHHMRKSLDLETILQTTVKEVRQFLDVDRVILYRLNPDWSGVVVAESVAPGWLALLNLEITDADFVELPGSSYHNNDRYAVADIYAENLSASHIQILERFQVRAKLVVPILQPDRPWGLLIAHQCRGPRRWQSSESRLVQQLAGQVAIAIQQSELYAQVQHLNSDLEVQVQERTVQLQQSLDFEALLKRITDKVRDSLDEQQIIQAAVEELAQGLPVEACDAGIYNGEQTTSTIAYEFTHTLSASQGLTLVIAEAPHAEIYPYLLQGRSCQFCNLFPNPLRSGHRLLTVLACPIIDDQGVLGDLWLFKPSQDLFNDLEIRLVQQVANQFAIALRQARLYQSAQKQVQELEQLNQLKDDFLSTVSHELRTPMSSIKMAAKMLEISLEPLGILAEEANATTRYFHILELECQRETNLINDLLDLAHLDAATELLHWTTIDLRYLLPHIAEPFLERTRQQRQYLEIDVPDTDHTIRTDVSYMERCITELLNNACKYTPFEENIRLGLRSTPEEIDIQVQNFGVTIAEPECDRIFDKFYRIPNGDPWKHGGTGLGLALVKKMVDRLEGSIMVVSQQNSVTFRLRFPRRL